MAAKGGAWRRVVTFPGVEAIVRNGKELCGLTEAGVTLFTGQSWGAKSSEGMKYGKDEYRG